ncbi:hypothetical protein [Parapedobacter tibetensis]|uniref:hypothetical protein n=1 Tax=Parapedobacter tibetensis TaxID=2972951 RepID=UPI00214D7A19|nr:hypothetical protein [Parapedobacter tibetensis]
MKAFKHVALVLVVLSTISSLGCKKEDKGDGFMGIREAAWESLSETEQSTVIVEWQQASVAEASYRDTKAYTVTFSTSDSALLGPIVVYLDKRTLKVLGQGLRF